jgi:hypothetical protein
MRWEDDARIHPRGKAAADVRATPSRTVAGGTGTGRDDALRPGVHRADPVTSDGEMPENTMGAALALRHLGDSRTPFRLGEYPSGLARAHTPAQHLRRLLRDKPELIDDIGLTVEQAEQEITKPFWRRSCVDGSTNTSRLKFGRMG